MAVSKKKKGGKAARSKVVNNGLDKATVSEESIFDFALRNMKVYSQTVNEDRSVPDLYDGLKPVQRRVLYSALNLFSSATKQIKTARLTGHCFAAGTLIRMSQNLTKPIEAVEVGDIVATDIGLKKVSKVFVIPNSELVQVRTQRGVELYATPDQIFYCVDNNSEELECEAQNLRRHMLLKGYSEYEVVESVSKVKGLHTTYDFEVEERHRFYAEDILVHNCSGTLHPHGTASIAGAVATMVNSEFPPLYGVGNWGSPVDPPAAERYTELNLTDYGRQFFHKDYLAVTEFVPNYDGTSKEPVSLPSLLPSVFLNETMGIGVGLTTNIPAFRPDKLIKLCSLLLQGKEIDEEWLVRNLPMYYSWGGKVAKTKANYAALKQFFETGQGTVQWQTIVEEDRDKKLLIVKKFAPSLNFESFVAKVNMLPEVDKVYSDKGLSFLVQVKKSVNFNEFDKIKAKVEQLCATKVSYRLNVTERKKISETKYEVKFLKEGFLALLIRWLKYRVRLERLSLQVQVKNAQQDINYTELLIQATDNLDVIFAALRTEDPAKHIAKGMRITLDQANLILELKVRQLTKLDQKKLKEKLKQQLTALKSLNAKLKYPARTVQAWFDSLEFDCNDSRWKNQFQFYLSSN